MKLALNHVLLVGATEGATTTRSSLRDKTVDNAAIISVTACGCRMPKTVRS